MICVKKGDKICENISFVEPVSDSTVVLFCFHTSVVFGYLTRCKTHILLWLNIVIKFRIPPPGMETHIPVLFLDLNGKFEPDVPRLITLN